MLRTAAFLESLEKLSKLQEHPAVFAGIA
jgi:hypothetical protein